jgi:deferrochelatase/peroxidase EfeB
MRVDLTETRIDHRADNYWNMLQNLQGNILKGHGRNFSVHIFLQFKSDPQILRNWVRNFAEHYVTSTQRQLKEADEFRTYGVPGRLFGNFFLSAKGYEALGYTREDLAGRFVEKPAVIDGHEVVNIKFVDGMAAARHEINDPAPETWEAAYQGQRIKALLLLADNDEAFLLRQARQLIDAAQTVATVLTVELGRVMRNNRAESIEHFGYVEMDAANRFSLRLISSQKKRLAGFISGIPVPPWTWFWLPIPMPTRMRTASAATWCFASSNKMCAALKSAKSNWPAGLGLKVALCNGRAR